VDLHHVREAREAELRGDRRLGRRAAATRKRELALAALADTTWVVSPVERGLLLPALPGADVRVVSNIIEDDTAGAPFEQRHGLLFVGGLRHPPNRDAAEWLVSDIFPRVRAELPEVELHLVGDPGHGAAALPVSAGVVAHGHVPDLAPLLDGCRIAVAPLRFGAGVKGKINLSQAHGQPVVATACAVEGMHLQDGEDVLVADDAAGFAARIVRLYRDADLWRTLAENGRANVRRHFSPEAALDTVRASLGPPGSRH
jgi:glycosyltransferase involved in cell wall biosynthesis